MGSGSCLKIVSRMLGERSETTGTVVDRLLPIEMR